MLSRVELTIEPKSPSMPSTHTPARLTTVATLAAISLFAAAAAGAQELTNHDPASAQLVTSDIPRFWRAVDQATLLGAANTLQTIYIDSGSAGVHDFIEGRIGSGDNLAAVVAGHPRYYAALRANTLSVDTASTIKAAIRRSLTRLHELYPPAVFPNVYFVIGAMNSGGTSTASGLLIGVEMNARDTTTPTGELSAWQRTNTGMLMNLPGIVAHELIHFQQPATQGTSLLARSLMEGAADFIGDLISGQTINRVQHAYGDAHEAALWAEFQPAMHGSDVSHWLYQGDKSVGRPADLGYYVGYEICKAYYTRARDKRIAVRDIINITDADAFLNASGYAAAVTARRQ